MQAVATRIEWSKQTSRGTTRVIYRCRNKSCGKVERLTYQRETERTYRSDMASPVLTNTVLRRDGREYRHPELRECCCKPMRSEVVSGHYDERVKCDARCTSAKGHQCECSCGGKNHGADHEVA